MRTPSSLPELMALDISAEYLDKTHFRNPPKVEIGYDGIPRYRGEADDSLPSPRTTTAPLSTNVPLLSTSRHGPDSDDMPPTPTVGKRAKRSDPYGAASGNKRPKKAKSPQQQSRDSDAQSSGSQPSPVISSPHQGPYGAPEQSPSMAQAYHYSYSVPPPAYFPHPGYAVHPPASHAYPSPPAPSVSPTPLSIITGSNTAVAASTNSPASAAGQPVTYSGYQPPMGPDSNQPPAQPYTFYPHHPHYQYAPTTWAPYQYPAMQGMHPPPQTATSVEAKGSDAQSPTDGEATDET